jgi:NodT family efflux transporter outer membrane factor (OMF) lipoprotein
MLTLSGCMVGPDYARPDAKVQTQFSQPTKSEFTEEIPTHPGTLLNPVQWWMGFNDPTLSTLLARAAKDNLSLQNAALRIYQARASLGVADATLLPTVGLGGSGARTNQPSALTQATGASPYSNSQSLIVQANWEIDFWGKYRRGIESATSSLIATAAAFYAADASLASEVANTYISIRNYEALKVVATTNLALQAESLRIAQSRYRNGATSLLDLSQAQSQYEQTKADIPAIIASLKKSQYAMSLLLGELPNYYEVEFWQVQRHDHAATQLRSGNPQRPVAATSRCLASRVCSGRPIRADRGQCCCALPKLLLEWLFWVSKCDLQ